MDRPRRRANRRVGHGAWKRDRPPILGLFGRESGQLVLKVLRRNTWDQLRRPLQQTSQLGAWIYTDDWCGYRPLKHVQRRHLCCCHAPGRRAWAIDADGDGQREVHCNTLEGIWTGLRNFLRTFRGLSKHYLQQYVAVFEAAFNLKDDWLTLFRRLLNVSTNPGT